MKHERFNQSDHDEFHHHGQRNFLLNSETAAYATAVIGAVIIAASTQILEGRRLSRREKEREIENSEGTPEDKALAMGMALEMHDPDLKNAPPLDLLTRDDR